MAAASTKVKGPIFDPALCRCCRSIKKCRLLTAEYVWCGAKEVYSDMLMDCFGLLLSHLDGDKKDACICATCVVRLRDAAAFREQVLRCQQAFLDNNIERNDTIEVEVKAEPYTSDADSPMDDRDDTDYVPNKAEPKQEKSDDGEMVPCHQVTTRSSARDGGSGKKSLLANMRRMKAKLDSMLDNKAPKPQQTPKKLKTPSEKKRKLPTQKVRELPAPKAAKLGPDEDDMIYRNAITMVLNSYLCPFQNRISNYYCYYCRDQFTNPAELREHTLTHDPAKHFECTMENKKIPKMDITRIDCRLCTEKITDLASLRQHLSLEHKLKIYPVTNEFLSFKLTAIDKVECAECGANFPYFDLLKKHMIDHFGNYICDQCGACFLEQNSLRTHIKSHSKVESLFPCEICGKNLKSKYSRYLHITTVHEKKPTVNCYKCGDCFLSYALRNRHLIEVHGDKRTFPCKQCDKVYNRRKTLMEHLRRNHLKVFRHQCDLCEQRFYLPSRLKEHMATHTGERNFRCEFCDKSYPRLQALREHIRTHATNRRYNKKTHGFDMEPAF